MLFWKKRQISQDHEIFLQKRKAFKQVDRVTNSINELNLLLEQAGVIRIETKPKVTK